jgi:hypothetical protein
MAAEGGVDGVEGCREVGKIAAVDTAGVELLSEFAQQGRPFAVARRSNMLDRHCDDALDDFDGGPPRPSCARLFPRTLPARGGAPLGMRPTGLSEIAPPHHPHVAAALRRDVADAEVSGRGAAGSARRFRSRARFARLGRCDT